MKRGIWSKRIPTILALFILFGSIWVTSFLIQTGVIFVGRASPDRIPQNVKISNITDSGISFSNIATKDFSLTQISCKVEDKSQLLNIKNGQTVTVRGVVDTQTIGVIDVKQCEIIS